MMRAGPKNSKWGTEAARWVAPASKEPALDLAASPLAELSGEEEPRACSPVLRQLTKHLAAIKCRFWFSTCGRALLTGSQVLLVCRPHSE